MVERVLMPLEESYRYCAALTRAAARNFYYTFWLLPAEKRRGIFAVYTFSRRADDVVDAAAAKQDPATCEEGLSYMRSLLGASPPDDDPLAPALRDTLQRYRIPIEPFHDLIEGMKMDLYRTRYRTFDELRLYCYRAASTIGLICIEIFGHDGSGEAVKRPAIDLGIAMQLTNIIRDVGEDLSRGRVYLPQEELERFGVTEAMLERGEVTEPVKALLAFQIERARDYFTRAEAIFPHLHFSARLCPVLLKRFYSELLEKVEAAGYDVFHRRPRLSALRKIYLAGSVWLRSRMPNGR